MIQPTILVVDDDDAHRLMLEAVLSEEGYRVRQADDGSNAVAAVQERYFDLILMDIRMRDMDGMTALAEIHRYSPGIPVIMMTAYASVGSAVQALKTGAYDYLTKPIDVDELKILVEKALDHFRLERENAELKTRIGDRFDPGGIIGNSKSMRDLMETIALVAPAEAAVLITGESGTGKELMANAVHHNSRRRAKRFIKINCAALPESLLESELFGHAKGAFTGAVNRKEGRFRMADGGTIFLDEIAEMAPALQAKLLRALQQQEFEPVGSDRTVKVDVRVISATNLDLASAIGDGRFREDLYYRLNVVQIAVPPLRNRHEDIPLLADHFLRRYAEKNKRDIAGVTPPALDLMMRYEWPGNVRELENVIERAVIMTRGERITVADLPEGVQAAGGRDYLSEEPVAAIGLTLKEIEREMILRTLKENRGNRTHAAEILGISRRTLQLKLKSYGINK